MAQPHAINIASGVRPSPEVFRQLIEFVLKSIKDDILSADNGNYIIEELFSMWGEDTIKAVKKYLTDHANIPVVLHWPTPGLALPQICVVPMRESENPDADFLGDMAGMIGRGAYLRGTDTNGADVEVDSNNILQRRQLGMGIKSQTNIYVRTNGDPALCVYLAHLVRFIVFSNKMDLEEDADVHNLTIDVEEVSHNPELFPEMAYTRVVSLSYDTYFDYNLPETVLERINLRLLVNTAKFNPPDGSLHDELAVPVPYSK